MNLRLLIAQGENETVDFKKTITHHEKIARTMVAFANHKGGKLLIGIADDGSVKGVKSEDEERFMILKSCHQYIKPIIEPIFEEIYLEHKLVLVVTIAQSDCKPHYALDVQQKWWAYIRMADKSVLASKVMLDVLKQQQQLHGTLITYTDNEAFLMKYIAENGQIDLKIFCKKCKLSLKNGQKIIVKLVLAGLIKNISNEKEEYFVLV